MTSIPPTMPQIVSFKDKFTYHSGAFKAEHGVDMCKHAHRGAGASHPPHFPHSSRNTGSPGKSPYCHEQGQKVDNSNVVIQKIADLCESQELSDLQITVGGKRYYTHKLLLCCASDVFRIMLTNPAWPDAKKGEIMLTEEEECLAVFDDFLRYIYSGCVHLTHYNVLPTLMLADKYNVGHLRSVCIDYMCCHVVSTTSHNHAVSWLQYAYNCGHRGLAEVCRHFILCNFHKVMSTVDYLLMQKDVLIDFLLDSNLVIPDEFTLFQGVVHWLQNTKLKRVTTIEEGESWKMSILDVLSMIRFPMMSLPHLCQLEKEALTNDFHSFFMDKINKAMQYHSSGNSDTHHVVIQSCVDDGDDDDDDDDDASQYRPRNYTNDVWSTTIVIDDFSTIADNEVRPLLFTTPVSGSEADEKKSWGWNLDFFPKGVQFQKCIMIGLWRNLEICGSTHRTVRLKLETQQAEARDVEVSVLITGVQDAVEYVKSVIVRRCLFDKKLRVHILNDIVPYDELNRPGSDFLTGANGMTFKIAVIIKPV